MQHITLETLARLMDEAPSAAETAHLAGCGGCRAELEALRAEREALRELPDLPAPASGWSGVEQRLRAEGLIRPGSVRARSDSSRWLRPALQVAAALALFVAGAGANELWRGAPGETGGALRAGGGAGSGSGARMVSNTPASLEEAAREVADHEAAYLEALTRYAELSGGGLQVDPLDRLAALEGIVLTTRAALDRSPADPVINGYHLAALSQREALLRQVTRRQAGPANVGTAESDDPWF